MTELTVHFPGPASLLAQEQHLQHAGLFLPALEPMPAAPSSATLYITCSVAEPVTVTGQVVQAFPGTGFAFAPDDAAELQRLLDAAREAPGEAGGPAVVGWLGDGPSEDEEQRDPGTLFDRVRALNTRERMHLARHGGKAERTILLKDSNKTIHTFLVQNPRITLDEIRYIAGYRQAGPDALKMISENRTWMQNSGIVSALVRNPKTPASIAIKLLDRVPKAELARLAKSSGVMRAVQEAARKRVMSGPR